MLAAVFVLKIVYEAGYTMMNICMGSLLGTMATNDAERATADEIEEFWKEENADPVLDPKKATKRCIFTNKDDDEQESF